VGATEAGVFDRSDPGGARSDRGEQDRGVSHPAIGLFCADFVAAKAEQIRTVATIASAAPLVAPEVGMVLCINQINQVEQGASVGACVEIIARLTEMACWHGGFAVFHVHGHAGRQCRNRTRDRLFTHRTEEDCEGMGHAGVSSVDELGTKVTRQELGLNVFGIVAEPSEASVFLGCAGFGPGV